MIGQIATPVVDVPAVLLARRAGGSPIQDGNVVTWLIVLGVAVAVICLAAVLLSRWLKRQRESSHRFLFRGLCRAHGLGMRDSRLLWRFARIKSPSAPARLFIEPAWFDPTRLPAGLKPQANDLVHLRERIFSRDEAVEQPGSPQSA